MSNFITPITTDTLLSQAESENLYIKLIEQINKDFNLANEAIDFPQSTSPRELKIQLHEKVYRLIQYKFAEYLNLLYIIDVPENQVKQPPDRHGEGTKIGKRTSCLPDGF